MTPNEQDVREAILGHTIQNIGCTRDGILLILDQRVEIEIGADEPTGNLWIKVYRDTIN
jgi:hypothetical protein